MKILKSAATETFINKVEALSFQIPTDAHESDGTFEWDSTTMILAKVAAGNKVGIGFSYGHACACHVIKDTLATHLMNADPMNIPYLWNKMLSSVRNIGSRGIAANAISAVDIALWDLKAKLLEIPLCKLFGQFNEKMPIYGSGGFTSYSSKKMTDQLKNWQKQGIKKFKIKVGRQPQEDLKRVKLARKIIGEKAELFVDANGAYSQKQALDFAQHFAEVQVTWLEEPVSSDDLEGLNLIRNRAPYGMNIAAGEYGYDLFYFRRMLEAQAIDVLQVDATRCCGFTGFLKACHLSHAFNIPISSHTAPSIHLHVCLSEPNILHMEFFHDHSRIEEMLFDGFPKLIDGYLCPNLERNGHGLELKEKESRKFLL